MRLIDADTLIKDLSYLYTKNHIPVDMRAKETLSKIMEQPTTYDADKVIEQLRERSMLSRPMGMIPLKEAVEIVKRGGKEQ